MIVNTIWDTELAEVSATAKLVYVWSFTNPACGMAGVYPVRVKQIAGSLDLERTEAQDALDELCEKRLLWHDGTWLWVRGRVKNLHTRTTQIAASIDKDLKVVPDGHQVLGLFAEKYGEEPWLSELHANLKRGSAEVQNTPSESQKLNLTRTSPEVPLDVVLVNSSTSKNSGLDLLLTSLAEIWPSTRCRPTDATKRDAALWSVREDLPDDLLAAARLYLDAHGFTDQTIEGCPNLHKWIEEKRWADPLPSKSKTTVADFSKYDKGIEAA